MPGTFKIETSRYVKDCKGLCRGGADLKNLPNAETLRKAFGNCIRDLRLRLGIAQEQLALQCGVNRGYMGELERGEHSPTIETIYRLLPVLEVSFTQFASEYEMHLRRVLRNAKGEP